VLSIVYCSDRFAKVIPVFYVMVTLWSIMGGIVLYRELNNMALTTNVLFMVAVPIIRPLRILDL
jgi:hypothetical protein